MREPLAGAGEPLGLRAQLADHAGDLGREALALHEQHAVEGGRGLAVEVLGGLEGAQGAVGGRADGGPPVGQRVSQRLAVVTWTRISSGLTMPSS